MDSLSSHVAAAARVVWDYHISHGSRYDAAASPADAILVLCSNDTRVADRGADLFLAGAAPLLVFSGGVGYLTRGLFGGLSEAEAFARVAISRGVPATAIIVEGASTNTGENIAFSREALAARGVLASISRLVLVQKPFMERRTLATFLRQWPAPAPAFTVTSPQLSLEEYADASRGLPLEHILAVAAGDLQRIAVYPGRGFQVYQPIPQEAWDALKVLVRAGFTSHMIRRAAAAGGGGSEGGSTDAADAFEGLDASHPPPAPPSTEA